MKKNPLYLFLGGLGLLAVGLGFLKTNGESLKQVNAENISIEFDGNAINFGSYPTTYISDGSALDANAKLVDGDKYEYKGEYYSYIKAQVYSISVVIGPGIYNNAQIDDSFCWFKWETIQWLFVKEEGDYSYFVSRYILDTSRWQVGDSEPKNDWESSTIRGYLSSEFLLKAFTDDQRNALTYFRSSENTSHKDISDYVSLPSKGTMEGKPALLNSGATNYAVCRALRAPYGDDYYYYLNSTENVPNTDNVDVVVSSKINGYYTVNDTTVKSEVGFRPLIAIGNKFLAKKTPGGGGGSGGSTNVALIIGFIFSILGMAGVVAFFMLWKKGKLIKIGNTKMPIMLIASISVSVLISIVGMCMIFANTGGVGYVGDPVGYYTTTEFTLDTNSPDFGRYTFLGLARDHKVYRYSFITDGAPMAKQTLIPYPSVGSWKIQGKKLIITAGLQWPLFDWENQITSYHGTNGFGFALHGMIMNDGNQQQAGYQVKGYRWSHASSVNPTGEEIVAKDAKLFISTL